MPLGRVSPGSALNLYQSKAGASPRRRQKASTSGIGALLSRKRQPGQRAHITERQGRTAILPRLAGEAEGVAIALEIAIASRRSNRHRHRAEILRKSSTLLKPAPSWLCMLSRPHRRWAVRRGKLA